MKDVKPTQLLKGTVYDVESSPDFSSKDYTFQHSPQPVAACKRQSTPSATAAPSNGDRMIGFKDWREDQNAALHRCNMNWEEEKKALRKKCG